MLIIMLAENEERGTAPQRAVTLSPRPGPKSRDGLDSLHDRAAAATGSVPRSLALAAAIGTGVPFPGSGSTLDLWETLATLAAADLSVARTVEPHLDALAILQQAGVPAASGTWGVFAAEGPDVRLEAHDDGDDGWRLTGRKPWCSLAGKLDHAIVTARTEDDAEGASVAGDGSGASVRRAFAVDLRRPGVRAIPGTWVSRGLSQVDSGPVDFDDVSAAPVGLDNWYLQRDGFAWGGLGVAACWYGGAVGVARRLFRPAGARLPDQLALMHLGNADLQLHGARCALAEAAASIDGGRAAGVDGALLAERVRGIVATAAETVISISAHALGPGPLVQEEDHARRVADLQVYLRQHHAERDAAALGRRLLDVRPEPW